MDGKQIIRCHHFNDAVLLVGQLSNQGWHCEIVADWPVGVIILAAQNPQQLSELEIELTVSHMDR